jgi:hypothetical protein
METHTETGKVLSGYKSKARENEVGSSEDNEAR